MIDQLPEDVRQIIYRIRELFVQAGGNPLNQPEAYGCVSTMPATRSAYEILTDYDHKTPVRLRSSEGEYVILGSYCPADMDIFWPMFTAEFSLVELEKVETHWAIYSAFALTWSK